MNAADLILVLQRALKDADLSPDDVEVCFAHQPNYPLEAEISANEDIKVTWLTEVTWEDHIPGDATRPVIYLPAGDGKYLTEEGRVTLGW